MTEPLPRTRNRILVVEPMSSGNQLLVEARALGFELVVASYDRDDRRIPDPLREHIDELVVVDTNDEPALYDRVAELHRERPFAGIVPGFEFYVGTAARLAGRLGLRGLPVADVEALRDKAVMRDRARAAGLRVPRYAEASDAAGLDAAAAHVGFPAVLKPTRSAGSVHVTRVENARELHRAYDWIRTDPRTDLGRGLDGPVLLEEYVAGPEVSVEGYVLDGQVVIVSVTSKLLGAEPYFVELGMIVQHELEPPVRAAVEARHRRLPGAGRHAGPLPLRTPPARGRSRTDRDRRPPRRTFHSPARGARHGRLPGPRHARLVRRARPGRTGRLLGAAGEVRGSAVLCGGGGGAGLQRAGGAGGVVRFG
ncbi:ATP-grasp domain-containing protein [Streptomyces sp. NPDC001719]